MRNEEKLWRFVDGELPGDEARTVEAEMAADEAIAGRVAWMRAVKAGVLEGAPLPPEGFADRVAAAAGNRTAAPLLELDEARRFLRRVCVAAAILAAVSLVYLVVEVVPNLIEPVTAGPEFGGNP